MSFVAIILSACLVWGLLAIIRVITLLVREKLCCIKPTLHVYNVFLFQEFTHRQQSLVAFSVVCIQEWHYQPIQPYIFVTNIEYGVCC